MRLRLPPPIRNKRNVNNHFLPDISLSTALSQQPAEETRLAPDLFADTSTAKPIFLRVFSP